MIQGNGPASWTDPYWSFFADFEMCALMVTGRTEREYRRVASGMATTESPRRKLLRLGLRFAWFGYLSVIAIGLYQEWLKLSTVAY